MNSISRFIFLAFLIFTISVQAQLQSTVVGDAIDQGNNCFIITPDLFNQSGGAWFSNPIDFDEDFTIYYQNNFGTKDDDGADGMALVFKGTSTPEIGGVGGGMGYQGINNSFIVEFDTFENNNSAVGLLNDPQFDHLAIKLNGNPDHNDSSTTLTPSVPISSVSPNVEDGIDHDIKIEWIAATQEFLVYFDCELRLSLIFDIKNNVFNGDDTVFFGFVGSTGGLSNLHQVCFNSISFVDNLQIQDESICNGDFITVNATIPSGNTYSWTPTTGVGSPNSPVTIIAPTATTTYTVTILDNCGDSTVEEFTVTVSDIVDPIFDIFPEYCSGDSIPNLPIISNNNIEGSWTPAINNTQTTTYTFTPNTGECANILTRDIIINPIIIPDFDTVDPICEGDTLSALPLTSNNNITGSWSPALDNTQTTTYTFIPDNSSICAESVTLDIVVNTSVIPEFDNFSAFCEGESIDALPTTSNNNITGTWSPPIDNTQTTTYNFTPNPDECAENISLEIIINPQETPVFDDFPDFCEGEAVPELPLISNNGIAGTWSPEIDNTQTTTYTFTPNDDECSEEITLSIEIIELIMLEFSVQQNFCIGEAIPDLPLVSDEGITGVWSPELDTTMTTTYTFFPDEGQGCIAETSITITVNEGIIPTFNIPTTICEGDSILPLPEVSIEGIKGIWSPILNVFETTTYTFVPDVDQCAQPTEFTIVVNAISELVLDAVLTSEPFSDTLSVLLQVIGGNGDYEYRLNNGPWQTSNMFTKLPNNSFYNFEARQIDSCSTIASDSVTGLSFPDFFTPNEDGFNDYWNIRDLKNQTEAVIYIFDRYGKLLVQVNPLQIGWDGTYQGRQMPSQDYWFLVEFRDEVTGNKLSYNNHFTLKR